jgi:hypothetical protein
MNKKTPTSDRKPRKAKNKITWRRQVPGPLGKGNGSTYSRQNHDQAKSTTHQSIQDLHLHICKLPLNKCQTRAQTGQAGSQNRSNWFHITGQTGSQDRSGRFRTPKSQNAKEMHKIPHDSWDRFQGWNATFLHLCPPHRCCQCMNPGSSLKKCNLEHLKYTKFITKCYTCPNKQVRYSTAS